MTLMPVFSSGGPVQGPRLVQAAGGRPGASLYRNGGAWPRAGPWQRPYLVGTGQPGPEGTTSAALLSNACFPKYGSCQNGLGISLYLPVRLPGNPIPSLFDGTGVQNVQSRWELQARLFQDVN